MILFCFDTSLPFALNALHNVRNLNSGHLQMKRLLSLWLSFFFFGSSNLLVNILSVLENARKNEPSASADEKLFFRGGQS